jgi:galactose mutarotase-like enzyme
LVETNFCLAEHFANLTRMPSLLRRPSGEAAVGELIELLDESTDSQVTVAPGRGGLVTSFRVAGRELLYLDPATLNDANKNVRGGIPVLFPTPGKLEQDRWQWGSQSGELKQHGFARNLEFTVAKADPALAELVLQLTASSATLAVYPWDFLLELRFRLEGKRLSIASRIENRGLHAMPSAIGYHPYFLVTDKAKAKIHVQATRAFNNVNKLVAPFTGFDLTAPEVDLHLLDNPEPAAALDFGDGARLTLRTSSDFSVWVVWTVAGKEYVCVEPWTAPGNALNSGERVTLLQPGATQHSFFDLEWSAP